MENKKNQNEKKQAVTKQEFRDDINGKRYYFLFKDDNSTSGIVIRKLKEKCPLCKGNAIILVNNNYQYQENHCCNCGHKWGYWQSSD